MEIKKLDIESINSFWIWFSDCCDDLGQNFDNEELLNELDDRINELGEFAWEIGPGIFCVNQLVISPGGDLDLLPYTKEIVSYAKVLPNWEFHYAKPPKQWDLIFDFEKHDGSQIEINASQWKYVLLKYDDGMFEIIIQTHDLQQLDEDDQLNATEILLDGILGEENRMLYVCGFDVVDEFEEQFKSKKSDIRDLNNHIKRLTLPPPV
jgi:hypothetical protein